MDPDLRKTAAQVLDDQWRPPGFTCPNATTYPWLWLWDSCFHAVVNAELGRADRAVAELTCALSAQDGDGFVPHLQYLDGSHAHQELWGRPRTSSITQPPIYAAAVVELAERGVEVPDELVDRSRAGLRFLLEHRRRSPAGLVQIVHPWESGCDHSPRWDDLMGGEFDQGEWFDRKGALLATIERSPGGAPLHNPAFPVGSVAFSALVAHGARRLGTHLGDRSLRAAAEELAGDLFERWDPGRRTFIDDGPTSMGSGRVRTAEALLPVLVADPGRHRRIVGEVAAELDDPDAFAGPYGPTQVHRAEPSYSPGSYWRGPSWPQIDLLLWWGLRSVGDVAAAAGRLAAATVRGAVTSGWAEYWDSDDGAPGGARPQSWTTVAVLMDQGNETT